MYISRLLFISIPKNSKRHTSFISFRRISLMTAVYYKQFPIPYGSQFEIPSYRCQQSSLRFYIYVYDKRHQFDLESRGDFLTPKFIPVRSACDPQYQWTLNRDIFFPATTDGRARHAKVKDSLDPARLRGASLRHHHPI